MRNIPLLLLIFLMLLCHQAAAKQALDVEYHRLPNVDSNLLSLDMYWPQQRPPKDVVIMIHGGSWQRGDKAAKYLVTGKVDFFTERGFMYVSTNYRLSPAVKMPEHPRDVARAIAYVHRQVPDANLWLIGHSSGAHLAAIVSTNEAFLRETGLDLDVLSGTICLDTKYVDVSANSRLPTFNKQFIPKVFGTDRDLWQYVNPMKHIESNKRIPSFLVFYTDENRMRRRINERFATTLQEAGVAANAIVAKGYDHRLIILDVGRPGDPLTNVIMRFFEGENPVNLPDVVRR